MTEQLDMALRLAIAEFTQPMNTALKSITTFQKSAKKSKDTQIFSKSFFTNLNSGLAKLKEIGVQLDSIIAKSSAMGGAAVLGGGGAKTQPPLYMQARGDTPADNIAHENAVMARTAKLNLQNHPIGKEFVATTKVGKDGYLQSMYSMKRATSTMAQGSIRSMLGFKAMFGKILHYITFSIGVQMVMALRQGITTVIDDFKEFERAATNAATVSGYLGGSFTKVRDHIMDVSKALGKETVFGAKDVAASFYSLASAGYEVANMTKQDLIPFLNYAAATQSTLKDATYAVSTSLKAFSLDIEDATRVVDVFTGAITNSFMTFDKMREAMKYVGPMAGALGIELEETVAALSMLVDRGMEGSQAGQRLNMIFTKLLKPTEKTETMLAAMGLTMADLNPEVYTLTEILYKLKAAGFGAAEAATMFRARTAASATVLVDSAEAIDTYNRMLKSTVGITKSVAEQQETTLWGAFQLMGNTIQEIGLTIGEKFLPDLLALADFIKTTLAPVLMTVVDVIRAIAPALKTLLPLWMAYKIVITSVKTAMSATISLFALKQALMVKGIGIQKLLNATIGEEASKKWILYQADKAALKQSIILQSIKSAEIASEKARNASMDTSIIKHGQVRISYLQLQAQSNARVMGIAQEIGSEEALTIAKEHSLALDKLYATTHMTKANFQQTAISLNASEAGSLEVLKTAELGHSKGILASFAAGVKKRVASYANAASTYSELAAAKAADLSYKTSAVSLEALNLSKTKQIALSKSNILALNLTSKNMAGVLSMNHHLLNVNKLTNTAITSQVGLRKMNVLSIKEEIVAQKLSTQSRYASLVSYGKLLKAKLLYFGSTIRETLSTAVSTIGHYAHAISLKVVAIAYGIAAKAAGIFSAVLAINPIFLAIMAIIALATVIYNLVGALDTASLSLSEFMDVDPKDMSKVFTPLEAIIGETIAGTNDMNEAIRLLARDGAYSMDELKESIGGAVDYENLMQGATEHTPSLLGPIGDMINLAGWKIPGVDDFSGWLKEFIQNLTNTRDDALLLAEDIEETSIRMAIALTLPAGATEEEITNKYNSIKATIAAKKASILLASEVIAYNNALESLNLAIIEESVALENLTAIKERMAGKETTYISNIEDLIDAEDRYREAKVNRQKVETTVLTSIRGLIAETRMYSEALDDGIGYLEEWSAATLALESKNDSLTRSMRSEEKAAIALSEAIARHGMTSEQAVDAEIALGQASKDRAKVQDDIAKLETDVDLAEQKKDFMIEHGVTGEYTLKDIKAKGFTGDEVKEMLQDEYGDVHGESLFTDMAEDPEKAVKLTYALTDAQVALLNKTQLLVAARDEYITSLSSQAVLEAKVAGLEMVRDKYLTLSNEKLKLYLEAQMKVMDIEEKLYKLREGTIDQFDDLFQEMAEEGLVNDETIGLYKEMMTADGELLGMKNELMDVYGRLDTEQEKLAANLINTTDGTEAAAEAEKALRDAGVSESDIAFLVNYNIAQDRLNDSVLAFGAVMGPLLNNLIEAGVVSPEVAALWGDIADNGHEAAVATIELAIAQSKVSDTMVGLIGNSIRLAKALMDENLIMAGGREAGEDLLDIYRDFDDANQEVANAGKTAMQVLLEQDGVWNLLGGTIEDVKDYLVYFYDVDSFDEVTDAMIANASAMIKGGNAASQWGIEMTGATLAAAMGYSSLQEMINEAQSAWANQESMTDLIGSVVDAVNLVGDAISDLTDILKDYSKLITESMGAHPIEVGLQFSFADTIEDAYGEVSEALKNMFADLSEEGADFSIDMMSSFDTEDWNKWIEIIENDTSGIGEKLLSELKKIAPELDFTKIYGGMDEEGFEKYIEHNAKQFSEVFHEMEVMAYIKTKWNNYDFSTFLSQLTNDIGSVRAAAKAAGLTVDIKDTWGDQDFASWLQSLTSQELEYLQSSLKEQGIVLPMELLDLAYDAGVASILKLDTFAQVNKAQVGTEFDTDGATGTKTDFDTWLDTISGVLDGQRIGEEIADGIISGFKSKEVTMWDHITGFFGNLFGGIGDWLTNLMTQGDQELPDGGYYLN